MREFPIRLEDEIKFVPWEMLEQNAARCVANYGHTLEEMAARGGLLASEALAILDNHPWEAVPLTWATLELKRRVETFTNPPKYRSRHEFPPALDWTDSGGVTHHMVRGADLASTVILQTAVDDRPQIAADRLTKGIRLATDIREGRLAPRRHHFNELASIMEYAREVLAK